MTLLSSRPWNMLSGTPPRCTLSLWAGAQVWEEVAFVGSCYHRSKKTGDLGEGTTYLSFSRYHL